MHCWSRIGAAASQSHRPRHPGCLLDTIPKAGQLIAFYPARNFGKQCLHKIICSSKVSMRWRNEVRICGTSCAISGREGGTGIIAACWVAGLELFHCWVRTNQLQHQSFSLSFGAILLGWSYSTATPKFFFISFLAELELSTGLDLFLRNTKVFLFFDLVGAIPLHLFQSTNKSKIS